LGLIGSLVASQLLQADNVQQAAAAAAFLWADGVDKRQGDLHSNGGRTQTTWWAWVE